VRSTDFHLITDWTLAAPCRAVWNELVKPEDWPSWWPAVERVDLLEPGDEDGVGALRRMTWRTALPYSLTFDMRTVRVQPMTLIEGHAQGELTGVGRWTIEDGGAQTRVRYDWRVEVTQPWMRLVAPLARPVFAWNHGVVMGWGRDGISRRLAAPA
jgi:hypothetical protein